MTLTRKEMAKSERNVRIVIKDLITGEIEDTGKVLAECFAMPYVRGFNKESRWLGNQFIAMTVNPEWRQRFWSVVIAKPKGWKPKEWWDMPDSAVVVDSRVKLCVLPEGVGEVFGYNSPSLVENGRTWQALIRSPLRPMKGQACIGFHRDLGQEDGDSVVEWVKKRQRAKNRAAK